LMSCDGAEGLGSGTAIEARRSESKLDTRVREAYPFRCRYPTRSFHRWRTHASPVLHRFVPGSNRGRAYASRHARERSSPPDCSIRNERERWPPWRGARHFVARIRAAPARTCRSSRLRADLMWECPWLVALSAGGLRGGARTVPRGGPASRQLGPVVCQHATSPLGTAPLSSPLTD
jgi:hypothetical protein